MSLSLRFPRIVSASVKAVSSHYVNSFNRVYSFHVYRVSRNDSISTYMPSSINYKSDIIEPAFVSASCIDPVSIRFPMVLSAHERFHRLVELGILLTFLFFSFFLPLLLSTFSVYCVWNGSLVHLLRIDIHRGGDPAV